MTTIANHYTTLKNLITQYENQYGRKPGSVHLLAVSKNQSIDKITAAYHAGQCCFGENYLQEALLKITALSSLPLEWHFIGPIQSNKTRKIAEHFSWVQSVDSLKIAKRLNDQRPAHLPPLNICIEVNVSDEAAKAGVAISDVMPLVEYCQTLPRLKLRGLMTIPAIATTLTEQRREFHKLQQLYHAIQQNGIALDTLSMGMSSDFEAAIAEGSTLVRIGTALFGLR